MKCKETRGNGWAFEFDNDAYPDIDDTTIVVLALLEGGERNAVADSVERARRWTLAMDSRNGAWAAFDRDNTRELLYRMPFSDFGAMIDPPTEDVTAHVLEMLAAPRRGYVESGRRPRPGVSARDAKAVGLLVRALGRQSRLRHVVRDLGARRLTHRRRYDRARGRLAALGAESRRRLGRKLPLVCRRVVCRRSEAARRRRPPGPCSRCKLPGSPQHPAAGRGLAYLCERQRGDGTWDEPECTGTGFPRDFYINYHLYRHLFPTMALAMARTLHAVVLRLRVRMTDATDPEGS